MFTNDIELLTKDGWQHPQYIEAGDIIATYNLNKDFLEYLPVTKVDCVHPTKSTSVLSYKGKYKDFEFTEDHPYLIWTNDSKKEEKKNIEIRSSDNVSSKDFFLRFVENFEGKEEKYYDLGDYSILMDKWVAFLGYFLPKGWATVRTRMRNRSKNGKPTMETDGYVGISKQDDKNLEYLEEVLEFIPWSFTKKIPTGTKNNYQFCSYSTEFAKLMTVFGESDDRVIPQYVFDLTKEQQMQMLTSMMHATGDNDKNRITTDIVGLRDDFQRLAIQLGFTSDSYIYRHKGDSYRNVRVVKDVWAVSYQKNIFKSSGSIVSLGKPEKVDYKGNLWDFENLNQTVLLRSSAGKFLVAPVGSAV